MVKYEDEDDEIEDDFNDDEGEILGIDVIDLVIVLD